MVYLLTDQSVITQMTTTKTRQRRKHKRPEEIVNAALALFSERGFSATRLEDVADRAGVAKGTVYLYFSSKEALLQAAVRQFVVPRLEQGEQLVQQHSGDTASLLRELVMGWWSKLADSPETSVPKLIIAESGNFPDLARYFVDSVVLRGRRLLRVVIERGIQRGELHDCNVDHVSRLFIAPIIYYAIWLKSLKPFDEPLDMQAFAESHINTILNGIAIT